MLTKRFYMKDIREFEDESGISVLGLFSSMSISNLAILLMLGNPGMTEEQAYNAIDDYTDTNDILEAFTEVRTCLLGKEVDPNDEGSSINTTKYETMTDVYSDMCMNIMSVGISYTEFWGMTTKEMYKAFDGIANKVRNDMNRELSMQHTAAAMIGASVWGKLGKEPPKIEAQEKGHAGDKYVEGYGLLGDREYRNLMALMSRGTKRMEAKKDG